MSFVVFILSSRPVLLTIQLKLKHNFARGEYTTICATWGQILSTELIMYKKLMLLSIDFQYWFLINWQTWNEAWPIRQRSSKSKQNQNLPLTTISQLYNWRWEVGGACGDSLRRASKLALQLSGMSAGDIFRCSLPKAMSIFRSEILRGGEGAETVALGKGSWIC